MLTAATYTNAQTQLHVSIDHIDILLKAEEVVNFPRLIPLTGNRLVLPYGRGRHTGPESRPVAISEDGGKTFTDLPADSPWADNVQTSGILGYMRDGAILYIDVLPGEQPDWWNRTVIPYHRNPDRLVAQPHWRLRRFSPAGELLESTSTTVVNLPWEKATYENYGTILEMDNGDLLTAFQCHVPPYYENRFTFTTFIARSTDGGRTFEPVQVFSPFADGKPIGDQGFCEPDMAILANGDILCMLRSGGFSPMYQSRSTDGGQTWSQPASIGWPGVKPDLCLLSNGVLACSGGRGLYGHPQVTYAMFSIDGTGETWEVPFAFHTGPGCSYTSNMERDGKFMVAYSDSAFQKDAAAYHQPFQSIKLAVLDVQKEPM